MSATGIARGLVYEIRPLPMAAAMLCALVGGKLAGAPPEAALAFAVLVFFALYAGHAVDSYVDYELRKEPKYVYLGMFEDSGGTVPGRVLLAAALAASIAFVIGLALLRPASSLLYLVGGSGLAIALCYSPLLDRNPVTVSLAYPAGAVLALLGGFFVASPDVSVLPFSVGLVFGAYLVGGKIVSDEIDFPSDQEAGKRTVPVALGVRTSRRLGFGLCVFGLAGAFVLASLSVLPASTIVGAVAAACLLFASSRLRVERGIVVLVAGGYAYLASVLAA